MDELSGLVTVLSLPDVRRCRFGLVWPGARSDLGGCTRARPGGADSDNRQHPTATPKLAPAAQPSLQKAHIAMAKRQSDTGSHPTPPPSDHSSRGSSSHSPPSQAQPGLSQLDQVDTLHARAFPLVNLSTGKVLQVQNSKTKKDDGRKARAKYQGKVLSVLR